MREQSTWWRAIFLALYLAFAILPLYWMLNMSFKTNTEIVSTLTLWPRDFTFEHYRTIFTDPAWYSGYINSLTYVLINTVISLAWRCRRPTRSRATVSSATSTCSSGC